MLPRPTRFQTSFQVPTLIRTTINSYRAGCRIPPFLIPPSANVPDLPQATSTSDDPSRPFSKINLPIRAISSISFPTFIKFLPTSPTFRKLITTSPTFFYLRRRSLTFEFLGFDRVLLRLFRASAHSSYLFLPELILTDSTFLELSQLLKSRDSGDLRASSGRLCTE
jgi:hypothetical protein